VQSISILFDNAPISSNETIPLNEPNESALEFTVKNTLLPGPISNVSSALKCVLIVEERTLNTIFPVFVISTNLLID